MKTLKYFLAIAASALMMFACQEDADIDNFVTGSALKLRFEIPNFEQVEVTRGAVEETEAYNVYLFVFDGEGNRKAVKSIDLSNHASNNGANSYIRTYDVEPNITLDRGTYDIYAIANTTSNALWNGFDVFNAAMTKNEFEAAALAMTGVENTSTRMTLSGHTTYTSGAADETAIANIQLSRPYAKVTFNVKTGTKNPNFTFTPTSYDIYNVPAQSRMFANSTNAADDYKDYTNRAINQTGTFEYWQLENKFDVVSGVSKYTDREKRKADRSFVYAYETSTYVVIYGEAIEKDDKNIVTKNAKVNYTIHLGDFSATGNMGNFSVERNTHYTYNVTVNGVDMIEVEAKRESGEYENGAEGTIIDMTSSKQVYNLDAHYETVLLQLDLNAIHTAGVDAMTVAVSTPLMEPTYKNQTVKWSDLLKEEEDKTKTVDQDKVDEFFTNYDAKWIEFMPVSAAAFEAYPGKDSDKLLDICQLMNAIYTKTLTDNDNDGICYVIAFVNEFYYDDLKNEAGYVDWPQFVNKQEGREMKILQAPEISDDGHSIYSQALCAFHQQSISTMFDIDAEGNVFGIEMYDETGDLDITTSRAGSNQNNGWANTKSYTPTLWSNVIRVANNSTTTSEDYTEGSEITQGYGYDGQPNGNKYVSMVSVDVSYGRDYDAAYACMQRNRDLNGNGTIDNDEIRWYMPAINQLAGFWYGEEALPTYARLFQGQTTDVKNEAEYKLLHHYYTSTSGNYRIFWAIEGSSYGVDNRDASQNSSYYNYQSTTHYTRCIRNLQTISGAPADIVTPDGNVATINGFTDNAYRLNTQSGQYPAHNERDIANKLPKAFKMAAADLNTSTGAVSYTIKAPQISSAVSSNGKTTLTFASVENGVNYYYTTTESAAQTNPITVENNQATINVAVDPSAPMAAPDVTATYSNSTLTLTLNSAQSGLEYYYTKNNTFATTNQIFVNSNTESISYSYSSSTRDFYIWAYNPTTGAKSLYRHVRTSRTGISSNTPETSSAISTIYVWAYSPTYRAYSNATKVTKDGVTIGKDNTGTVGNASEGDTFTMLQATTQPLCANYSEEEDDSDKGLWRVPNQRELTILTNYFYSIMSQRCYLSSTTFSNQNVGTRRYGYCNRNGANETTITLQASTTEGRIRCVRDVVDSEGFTPPSGM